MSDESSDSSAPQGEQTYAVFTGSFPTEPGWIGDDPDPEKPAGREVIELLLGGVDPALPSSEIWNHEGFGWSFNCTVDTVTVNVLVQYLDHWLVIVEGVGVLARLFGRKRYDEAVWEVCARVHRALASSPEVSRVRWLEEREYSALAASGDVL